MATKTIDATLFASSHPDIAKRTSVSGLLISLAMMVAGDVQKEKYDEIKAAAVIAGESVNRYIKNAISQRMEREQS